MTLHGLARLLASIMAAGNVTALDPHDPRLAHRAVLKIGRAGTPSAKALLARFGITVTANPDPEVGLRVRGMTRATWEAVSAGVLVPFDTGSSAQFTLPDCERTRLALMIDRLPLDEQECLYRSGADWASSSTSRKNRATSTRSSGRVLASFE